MNLKDVLLEMWPFERTSGVWLTVGNTESNQDMQAVAAVSAKGLGWEEWELGGGSETKTARVMV